MLIYGFVTSLLSGYFLTAILWATKGNTIIELFAKVFLSIGLGSGISSILYFLWLNINFYELWSLYCLDMLCLIVLFIGYYLTQRHKKKSTFVAEATYPKKQIYNTISLAFFLTALIALVLSIYLAIGNPYGRWDAWAIWNLKARFLYRGMDHWNNMLSPAIAWSHIDYPFLLPSLIARYWTYGQYESLFIPATLSILFAAGSVGLIVSSVWLLKNKYQAYLAGLILCLTPFFVLQAAYQYADIYIAYYFLSTLVLLIFQKTFSKNSKSLLMMAGLTASFAAFTKNEGILFFVIIIFTKFAADILIERLTIWHTNTAIFLVGSAPVIAVLFYFKSLIPIQNDIITLSNMFKIIDISRYQEIIIIVLKNLFNIQTLLFYFPLCILVFYLILMKYLYTLRKLIDTSYVMSSIVPFVAIIFTLLGYFFIYLITPHDPSWHIATSQNRLLLQALPSIIFLYFVVFSIVEKKKKMIIK